MDRRDFTKGLIGAGMTSSVILPGIALANPDLQGSIKWEEPARVQLKINGQLILLLYLVILTTTVIGLNLQRPVRRFPINRVGLGGDLGGLFRPGLRVRIDSGSKWGKAYLLDRTLVYVPNQGAAFGQTKGVIAHDDTEYAPLETLRPLRLGAPLTPSHFSGQRSLGDVYENDDELIGLIRPTIKF